jgi:protein-tyrosine phosphatase
MSPQNARVLFVCTANECRSPFAEAIARRDAGDLPVEFDSAGLDAWRRTVPPVGLARAREMDLPLSDHVSRRIDPDEVRDYDLVLALSRSHARELLAMDPDARPRIFTLKQFARWVQEHPRPRRAALGSWLDAAADRPGTDFIGSSAADDVADPLHEPIEEWRRMTDELESAIGAILEGLYPGQRD